MIQDQNPTKQAVFVVYLCRVPPVSPAIRLEEGGSDWWGRLHHIPSGQTTPLGDMDDLLPAIHRYTQSPVQPKGRGGLK